MEFNNIKNVDSETPQKEIIPIVRYAFIDVPNTESTTNQILGFSVDWIKTYKYLIEHWKCEKIFFYSGIEREDKFKGAEYSELSKLGCEVRAKPYSLYKNRDKVINIVCPECQNPFEYWLEMGRKWKSNCDVELSVDAMDKAKNGVEYLIFTGDGDFEYLIRNIIEKGVKVYIVSNANKIRVTPRYFISRFSKKLRDLIAEKKGQVFYVDINLWRMRIVKKKEIETKENATQVGVF